MFDAVLFDLDGTLLDTLTDLAAAVNHALASQQLPARSSAEVRAFTGNGIRNLIERSVPDNTPAQQVDATFDEFKCYYAQHSLDHTCPYPGIREMLSELVCADIPLAVISNKADFAVQELMHTQFSGEFQVVTGEREGLPRKPHRALIDWVVEQMKLPDQARIAYVGDSEVDIQTAHNADCSAVICTWGFRDPEFLSAAGAPCLVDTPEELTKVLLGRA